MKEIKTKSLEKRLKVWNKRRHKCIISDGNYFEGDNLKIDKEVNIFLKLKYFLIIPRT